MKNYTLLLFAIFCSFALKAQFAEVSVGQSYSNQAYYNINDDSITTLANEAWDLAFATDPDGAGIFHNESGKVAVPGPVPQLWLFATSTGDFASVTDLSLVNDSLFNDEEGWEYGSLNSIKNGNDPLDYGWGIYNSGKAIKT